MSDDSTGSYKHKNHIRFRKKQKSKSATSSFELMNSLNQFSLLETQSPIKPRNGKNDLSPARSMQFLYEVTKYPNPTNLSPQVDRAKGIYASQDFILAAKHSKNCLSNSIFE